jgi:hypothetical protein
MHPPKVSLLDYRYDQITPTPERRVVVSSHDTSAGKAFAKCSDGKRSDLPTGSDVRRNENGRGSLKACGA